MKRYVLRFRRVKTNADKWARYDEERAEGQDPILNTVYFQKWADPQSNEITITIHWRPIRKPTA